MDKALEVIMVAVILVVASVVVIAMLQGQTDNFSNYTTEQTQGSSCGLAQQRLKSSVSCPTTDTKVGSKSAYIQNKECWGSSETNARQAVCP